MHKKYGIAAAVTMLIASGYIIYIYTDVLLPKAATLPSDNLTYDSLETVATETVEPESEIIAPITQTEVQTKSFVYSYKTTEGEPPPLK